MVAPSSRPSRKGSEGACVGAHFEALPALTPALALSSPFPSVSRLYKAPDWHDFGALRGFRVNFSTADAFISMLTVHQDTVNIWSHLLGFFYFLHAVPETWETLQRVDTPALTYVWFGLFLLCAMGQMLTSTLYHTLRCVTKQTSETFLYIDFLGIVSMIGGAYLVGMTQGFYCSPGTVLVYMGVAATMLTFGMYCVTAALANGKLWIYAYLAMGAVVAFGLCPCLHLYFFYNDPVFGLGSQEFLQRAFLGMGGNYFLGACPICAGPPALPSPPHPPNRNCHLPTPQGFLCFSRGSRSARPRAPLTFWATATSCGTFLSF